MLAPTLGYEDDTEISKAEIAQVQLTEAIALFIEERFLCALTLSGAAEEVLTRHSQCKRCEVCRRGIFRTGTKIP